MSSPAALLPGSFNPLHAGHLTLAAAGSRILGVPVEFELSAVNVDKPELDHHEIERRRQQFHQIGRLWITRAATFFEKAEHFPGVTFVVGYDTAIRLVDPFYYGSDPDRLVSALRTIRQKDCHFLVGGRIDSHKVFREWDRDCVPVEFQSMFTPLNEADFRVDVSSSELRQHAQ